MRLIKYFWIIILVSFISACSSPLSQTQTPKQDSPNTIEHQTLNVMTHDSFAVSQEVLEAFQDEHQVTVKFIEAGDTGTAVNKAALSKGAPLADVFYGVDNTFLGRALKEDIFEPYTSPYLSDIPDDFILDPQHRVLPVDYGDVCLNYDVNYFSENELAPPKNLDDLIKPEYKGLLVVENPATSSPGLAFLLATIGTYGENEYLDYWGKLVVNEVKIVNDWETAYYNDFSRWGGTRPVVVSYGSSPPFEVIFAEGSLDEPPTAAVTGDGSCFRQIEFVGILKGTQNRDLAEKFIDFMLSPTFQEDIPLQMYVFPVNQKADLDETFMKYLAVPVSPVILEPTTLDTNREKWINAWTEAVLR